MKGRAILLLSLMFGCIRADSPGNTQAEQASPTAQQTVAAQEFNESEVLAVKLYPDAAKDGTELVKLIEKMDSVLKANNSAVFDYPAKPLVIAVEAANTLGIQPHWESLNHDEHDEVFNELAAGLIMTGDFTPQRGPSEAPALGQVSQVQPWKPGDRLGTIATTDGKTYANAQLTGVSPDSISVLVADGGADIPLETLPPDLQKRFGFDPQKAAFYKQQQYYENRVADLEAEVHKLQISHQSNLDVQQTPEAVATAPQPRALPRVTSAAYIFYLDELKNQSAGMNNGRYRNGPLAGMTNGQAEVYAQQQWLQMSDEERMAYEQKAEMFGPSPTQERKPSSGDQQTYHVEDSNGGSSQVIVTPNN